MLRLSVVLVIIFTVHNSNADSHLGGCPNIDPMPYFRMKAMLGDWYVVQKSGSSTRCIKYTFKEIGTKSGHYKFIQTEPSSAIWTSALYHEVHTVGLLTTPNASEPARMDLDLPLPDVGITKFTVFMTDYYNYAAIFMCKNLPVIHEWSAAILSRTPQIDMDYVDKVRTRLSSYNIDPFSLSIIKQTHCPEPGKKGIVLEVASDVVSSVGNKLHDLFDEPDVNDNRARTR